jgi:mannose-6-phosphate isomerase
MDTLAELLPLPPLVAAPSAGASASPRQIEKPWGYELLWAHGPYYAAKMLHIRAGHRLSLQYHQAKDETLMLLSGRLELDLEQLDGSLTQCELLPGQVIHIQPGRRHRMRAVETCEVLEVSTPELNDVVRLDDDYGRA